jgi:regulatory protein
MIVKQVTRKDAKNVTVYLDNNENLILSEDVFFNSGLRKGDEISEDRLSFFIEQNKIYYIKLRALSFIGRRFHSERELLIKLKSKSYDERLIKIVLNDFKDKSFVDDNNFAKHFIEEKLRLKKWGIKKIRAALFSKGISASIIDEQISKLDVDEDQKNLTIELGLKKLAMLKKSKIDERKYREKLIFFLISKGFDYEESAEACNKIIKQDFD